MAGVTQEILATRQAYPLDLKIDLTLNRIRHWYNEYAGNVYVAFSGGKDSTVLLHLVRSIFPEVPAVFVDTIRVWNTRRFGISFGIRTTSLGCGPA